MNLNIKTTTILCSIFGFSLYKLLKYINKLKKYSVLYPKNNIAELIGNTPILKINSISKLIKNDIYLKLECNNPSGSIKDRPVLEMFKNIKTKNIISPTIVEGTSGSTGISMSLLSKIFNYNILLFLPNDLSKDKYNYLDFLGINYKLTDPLSYSDPKNFSKMAENYVLESNNNSIVYLDQFNNINNFNAHYFNTAQELYDQLDNKIDLFCFGCGTGGTISGISKFLKEKNKNIEIILSDIPGSCLSSKINYGVFYTSELTEENRKKIVNPSIAEGIGVNRITGNFKKSQIDFAYKISNEEILHMSYFLIENEGLIVGPSTAMNLVAIVKHIQKYKMKNKKCATIMCDLGSRYLNKVYNPDYLKSKGINFEKLKIYNNLDFIDIN